MSSVATASASTTRAVVIVARDRHALYEYLRTAFQGLADVEVILDRRIASEQAETAVLDAFSCHDWEPDVYDELTLRGFVVKRVE